MWMEMEEVGEYSCAKREGRQENSQETSAKATAKVLSLSTIYGRVCFSFDVHVAAHARHAERQSEIIFPM